MIRLVQNTSGQENNLGTVFPLAYTSATTSGNHLIAAATFFATGPINPRLTLTDNYGNIWRLAIQPAPTAAGAYAHIFYAENIVGGANHTVTAKTKNATTGFITLSIFEFSGIQKVNSLDQRSGNIGTSTAGDSGNITSSGYSLFFAVGTVDTAAITFTPGNNFIKADQITSGQDLYTEYKLDNSTSSGAFTWSGSTAWSVGVANFLAAPDYKGPVNIALSAGIANLGALNSSQSSSQLVRTSTGNLYAVLVNSGDVCIYKSLNNGTSWSRKDYINVQPTAGTEISAAIDSTDLIHIIFTTISTTTGTTYIQFNTSTDTFGVPEKGPTSFNTITDLAIAVDSNDKPHVVMAATVCYSNRIAGTWLPAIQQVSALGPNIDIQINQNNIPQVSYVNTTSNVIQVLIGNKNLTTSFTSTNLVATGAFTAAGGTSLAIDSQGNTWIAYQAAQNGPIMLQKHLRTDDWSTWRTAVTNGFNGKSVSLAADGTDIYVFYERNAGGIAYDRYDSINGKWLGETIIQANTSALTTNKQWHNPFVKWSQYFNNGDTGANNLGSNTIEYLFDDGSTVYYDRLITAQISTGLAKITFSSGAGATTTSTSSTSSSTSTSISTTTSSTSTSISTSSTSTSTSISTSSTSTSISTSSTSTSISTSSTSTSRSTSTTSTSTSTSISTSSTSTSISTSSTSQSTSTSISTSTTSTSTSTSFSTSTTSTSTSISTSTTSTSTSTTSTSTSISTSTTSTSTSTSISTSTTSTSTSTTSTSTSSTSTSTTNSQTTSTSSTSTSISTSSTSTSTTSTSTSVSTSTTSTSSSTSISTSSTSTSTTSTSTSRSTSTSSTSTSFTTSSTSTSTSFSTSSTSSSTSFTTSSTSQSTSTSLSTSSTSSSTSTSVSISTSTSTTSTSTSLSTTTVAPTLTDINFIPRVNIEPDFPGLEIVDEDVQTNIRIRL